MRKKGRERGRKEGKKEGREGGRKERRKEKKKGRGRKRGERDREIFSHWDCSVLFSANGYKKAPKGRYGSFTS